MEIVVNYLAILVAAVASMVLGMLWFGPLFGKAWAALMGFTPEQLEEMKKKGMAKTMAISFAGSIITAFVLAHFAAVWQMADAVSVMQLPFWLWLGFVATVQLNSVLWEGKPSKLYFINVSYQLVSLSVMTAILIYWPF